MLPLDQKFRDGLGRLLTHGPAFAEATDFQGRYRSFQVNVNDMGGETNANLARNLKSHTQLNEPISRDLFAF